jgi:hypothetical protein
MIHCLFFNLEGPFDFGCCSLAQKMSFVDPLPACFRQWLITRLLSAFLPFQPLFTKSSCSDQFLAPPLLLWCAMGDSVSLLCVSFQFLVYCSVLVFFFAGGSLSAQGPMLVYSRGVWGKPHDAWCSPVGLPNVSQAGLEPMSSSVAAHLFSQCNVVWRSFPQARGLGCQSFNSPCCFISAKCGFSFSVRFWSLGAHAVCFYALVAILDPPDDVY